MKLIARKSTPLANGSIPISLRLAHQKQNTTHIRVKGMFIRRADEWNNDLSRFTRKKTNYKLLNKELEKIEERAENILELLVATDSFSYDSFKKKFNKKTGIPDNVFDAYSTRINELKQAKKETSTASYFNDSMKSLLEVVGKKALTFNDINYSFLKEYERKRRLKGNNGTTIAAYLRGLRAVHYDYCKRSEKPTPDCYRKFNIKSIIEPTKRKSLTREQLKALINYVPINKYEQRAIDVFLFSFYCNGINLKDMAQLTRSSIVDGRIEYRRDKTGVSFSIAISEPMQEIMNRYSSHSNKYLFPILKEKKGIRYEVQMFNATTNKTLKRIAKRIDLPNDISFYYARHTFAQQARESGFNVDVISQVMGHSSVEVTRAYLSRFTNDKLDNVSETILKNL